MHMIQATLPPIVERDALAVAADVAIVLTGLAVIVLGVVLVLTLIELRSTFREVRAGVKENFGPVSDRAGAIADNVEFITDRLRTDVRHLTDSVRSLSERLQQASDHMEDRIEDFNALMETVQGEAEEIFLDTAATVHGLKEGARSMASPRKASAARERLDPPAAPTRPSFEDPPDDSGADATVDPRSV